MQSEISVHWHDNNQTVIYASLPYDWTWDDAFTMIERVYQLQDTVNHSTDIIYDLRDVKPLPRAAMPRLRRLLDGEHPNDRLNVIITRDTFLRQMLELVIRTFKLDRKAPAQLRFTTSLDKALLLVDTLIHAEAS